MISQIVHNVRAESRDGRRYLVAPIVMIVPGVLSGSQGPLLYSLNELARTVDAWNGVPILRNHPQGAYQQAEDVLDEQGLGFITNARIVSGRLVADGWFDLEKTRRISPETLAALNGNRRIEVSTGLGINVIHQAGYDALGRSYEGIVQITKPDHLAILGTAPGACSIADGCGLNVEAVR